MISMNTTHLIITVIAAIGTAIFLYLMHMSRHGIPGLRALDKNFRLLDMRFHYTAGGAFACLEGVGPEGRAKLRRFWLIDFGFILCFLVVMYAITISSIPASLAWLSQVMTIAALLRALLDIIENLLLLTVCGKYPKQLTKTATLSGYVTSAKFVALFVWIAGLFVSLFLRAFQIA